MSERKELFRSYYLSLWSDGTIGVSDGVGYSGELERDEVMDLYRALCDYVTSEETERWRNTMGEGREGER